MLLLILLLFNIWTFYLDTCKYPILLYYYLLFLLLLGFVVFCELLLDRVICYTLF